MTITVGSEFAGYDGIGLALKELLGAEPIWFSEFEKAPNAILAHHWPDVPNLGDITKIDWSVVARPTIITSGSPCQDMSNAGKQAGMKAGTRSGLWSYTLDSIAALRPELVIWENVRGALSAEADSDLEPCAGCVGGDDDGPVLRALGRVLGDLAGIGYDAAWTGLRAADVGAPHGRFRVFVLAWPAVSDTDDLGQWEQQPSGQSAAIPGATNHALNAQDRVTLLPTPAVNDMGAGKTVDAWDAWTERMQTKHGNGNGHGASLSIEALRMLPTPRATDGTKGGPNQRGSSGDLMLPSAVMQLMPTPRSSRGASGTETMYGLGAERSDAGRTQGEVLLDSTTDFGQYAAAVERWSGITRPAPSPTEPTGKGGAERLSPRFVEWMQGLPEGHVTNPAIWATSVPTKTPGVNVHAVPASARNAQLAALGNGVCPQQCMAAIRYLLTVRARALQTERSAA